MAATSLHTVGEDGGHQAVARRVPRPTPTVRVAWQTNTNLARCAAVATLLGLVVAVMHSGVGIASAIGVGALVPAALVDVVEQRLPNRMVAAAGFAMCVALAVTSVARPSSLPDRWLTGLAIGAGLMAVPLLVLHLVSPSAMGFGDVKAGIVLGASAGLVDPQLAPVALFIASGGTALVGLAGRQRHLPFGPGLIIGTAAALMLSSLVLSSTSLGSASAELIGGSIGVGR